MTDHQDQALNAVEQAVAINTGIATLVERLEGLSTADVRSGLQALWVQAENLELLTRVEAFRIAEAERLLSERQRADLNAHLIAWLIAWLGQVRQGTAGLTQTGEEIHARGTDGDCEACGEAFPCSTVRSSSCPRCKHAWVSHGAEIAMMSGRRERDGCSAPPQSTSTAPAYPRAFCGCLERPEAGSEAEATLAGQAAWAREALAEAVQFLEGAAKGAGAASETEASGAADLVRRALALTVPSAAV